MAKTVQLPSKYFKTQKAATEFFKDMLNRYDYGQRLNNDDTKILYELLQRHHEFEEKAGVGVQFFYRGTSPEYHTPCFIITRIDGTETEFSYGSAITGKAQSPERLFYRACRHAVSDHLIDLKNAEFRRAGGRVACGVTGDLITSDEAEFQHVMPEFKDIIRGFISENNLTITTDLMSHGADMQDVVHFTNSELEAAFKKYHATKAVQFRVCKKYLR